MLLSLNATAVAAEEGGLYGIDQKRFDVCMTRNNDRQKCLKWAGPSREQHGPKGRAMDDGRTILFNQERYDYCVRHKLYGDRTDIETFCHRWASVLKGQ